MAECHFIGQIVGASNFPQKSLFCTWDTHFGSGWKLISGSKEGQTQIDYPQFNEITYWCHPLDIHLATKGVQGWPKLHIEVYHHDDFGRNELYGYGFLYLPSTPGIYKLNCVTWRPTGSLREEIKKYFLGGGLQLKKPDIIINGNDRYKLQTETMGTVHLEIGVILRNFHNYIKTASPITLKSENFKNLFCRNNICLKEDNAFFDEIETKKLVLRNAPKSIFDKKEELFNKKEITMNLHKNLLENKYMNIENKKKIFESNKEFDEMKLLNGIDKLYEKNEVLDDVKNMSSKLEIAFNEIKEEDEYISSSQNLSSPAEKNITNTSHNYEQELLPTIPLNPVEMSYNLTDSENICFCDLMLNQCDINCCCDKDCSPFEWKVFTKCDDFNYDADMNYCFKSTYIFKNNTKIKINQYNNGLFCIVNKNFKFSKLFKNENQELITSLKTFNKLLPKKFFLFSSKNIVNANFKAINYQLDSYIWVVEYGLMKPFGIYKSVVGFMCSDKIYIKYLRDEKTMCSFQYSKNNQKCIDAFKNIFYYLKNLTIIMSPQLINESEKFDYKKICTDKICNKIELYICLPFRNCVLSDKINNFSMIGCSFTALKIQYQIFHNGSEGIKIFKAYIWFENTSENSDMNFFQISEVKFMWMNLSQNVFKRSGNPGYLVGKPIFAGKKINVNIFNDTMEKKEVIEFSADSKNILDVLGSEHGFCSLEKRVPINFKENGHYSCRLKLPKENFNKEKCVQLQNLIFQLLLGKDVANITKENFFNKFVASFGNSRQEDSEAWVPVLINLFPLNTNQISFKSGYNYFICSNIVSDLAINVAYSHVGSFWNPQSKVSGVSFQLGTYKDILIHCDTYCESSNYESTILITTSVHFFDLTQPAKPEFAERLSLEIKLPHNFFYPFFSHCSIPQPIDILIYFFCSSHILILILLNNLSI